MFSAILKNKVGVLTLPLHHNYGGLLQFVALQAVLKNLGYEVLLLDFQQNNLGGKERFKKLLFSWSLKEIKRFKKKYIQHTTQRLPDRKSLLHAISKNSVCTIIVGSDQVWQERYTSGNLQDYFLCFLKDTSIIKIAYAASFGTSEIVTPLHTLEISETLKSFKAVSVRETTGIDILQNIFEYQDAHHTLDPTFLLPKTFYFEMLKKTNNTTNTRLGVVGYLLDVTIHKKRYLEEIAAEFQNSYTIIEGHPNSISKRIFQQKPSIEQWLHSIKEAAFVVTDSYHGMIFSIIFEKQFLVLVNEKRGAARFKSLAKQVDLEHRLVTSQEQQSALQLMQSPIDYSAVQAKLAILQETSIDFLTKNLS